MIDTQTIVDLLTPFSITVGVVYYVMTLRNTRNNQRMQLETRQAQLYMQFFKEICTPEFLRLHLELSRIEWDEYEDFRGRIVQDQETYAKLLSYWWTFGRAGSGGTTACSRGPS